MRNLARRKRFLRAYLGRRFYINLLIPFINGDQRCSQYMIIICIIAADQFYREAITAPHRDWAGTDPVIFNNPFVLVGKNQAYGPRCKPVAIAEIGLLFIKLDLRFCPTCQQISP